MASKAIPILSISKPPFPKPHLPPAPPLSFPRCVPLKPHLLLRTALSARRREELDLDPEMDEEEEEVEEEGMAFENMRRWMRNKPAGFGEGKTYDVLLEEEMLAEMERSRKAQLANLNKIRNGGGNAAKKQLQKAEAEVVTSKFCVRIANLPRKRNIHRDLQSAFKDFPGIIKISPAVIGNKKTREPVCRGFAFIYFTSEEAANRFVIEYSKKSLQFGKLQKPITCHSMIGKESSNSNSELFSSEGKYPAYPAGDMSMKSHVRKTEAYVGGESNILIGGSSNNFKLPTSHDSHHMSLETDEEKSDSGTQNFESKPISRNQNEMQKKRTASKRKTKKKTQETLEINVPGSANRLKIKERSVLIGVFSKYGAKAAPVLAK